MNADGSPTLLSGETPAAPQAVQSDTSQQVDKADWGIYIGADKLIEPDSIVALDYKREWTVADFPLEGGAFESYDKVEKPFDVRLRMTKGGNEAARRAFIVAIETIGESLDLVDVVTPDKTYLSVTVTSIGYRQTAANGVSLIAFDVALRQVRITASAALSAVQDPGSADPVNGATVQPQEIPPATQAEIKSAVKERQAEIDATMFATPAF